MKWVALVTLGCFCVLSSYCYGRITPLPHREAKAVVIWRTAKAAQIADIYGISPDEVNRPIRIFGK